MLSSKIILLIIGLITYHQCTMNRPIKELSCKNNLDFPRVFSVNFDYSGDPKNETTHDICSMVTESCCSNDNGDFYDLRHYWQGANSDKNFSSDSRSFSDLFYSTFVSYHEIWITKAKNLLTGANLDKDLKTIAQELVNDYSTIKEDELANYIVQAKQCYTHNSYLVKGMMCGLCSPEAFIRIADTNIYFDRKEAAEFGAQCGQWLQMDNTFAHLFEKIGKLMV